MLLSTGAKRSSRFQSWGGNLCAMCVGELAEKDDLQREMGQVWETSP